MRSASGSALRLSTAYPTASNVARAARDQLEAVDGEDSALVQQAPASRSVEEEGAMAMAVSLPDA